MMKLKCHYMRLTLSGPNRARGRPWIRASIAERRSPGSERKFAEVWFGLMGPWFRVLAFQGLGLLGS